MNVTQLPIISFALLDGNMSYNLDLSKFEKPYLDANLSQISSKSVKRFKRSQKCVQRRPLI